MPRRVSPPRREGALEASGSTPARRAPPAPITPLGPGVSVRRVRLPGAELVRLGAVLAGYDHLASLHDEPGGVTLVVTTDDRAAELDEVLAGLGVTVGR